MSKRTYPTGLPLVDSLRSCMLQKVPHTQTSGGCSSLPYDAADLIHDLYDALSACFDSQYTFQEAQDKADAALAKARGDA